MPGEPAELSLEDAERLREKRAQKNSGAKPEYGLSLKRGYEL